RGAPRVAVKPTALVAVIALGVGACGGLEPESAAMPDDVRLGGDTTVFAFDQNAFTHPAPNLGRDSERTFFKGRALFRDQWVAAPASTASRDGLGPLF